LFVPKTPKPQATSSENKLHRALIKEGIPFVAQKRITTKSGRDYTTDIVILKDFKIIPKNLMIVEVGYVNGADIQEYEDLMQTGYTVLHFKNKEIEKNINKVVQTIKKARLKP